MVKQLSFVTSTLPCLVMAIPAVTHSANAAQSHSDVRPTEQFSRADKSDFARTVDQSGVLFTDKLGDKITTFQTGGSITVKIADSAKAKRTFKLFFSLSGAKSSFVEFQDMTVLSSSRSFTQTLFVNDFPQNVAAFTVREFVNGRFVDVARCTRVGVFAR